MLQSSCIIAFHHVCTKIFQDKSLWNALHHLLGCKENMYRNMKMCMLLFASVMLMMVFIKSLSLWQRWACIRPMCLPFVCMDNIFVSIFKRDIGTPKSSFFYLFIYGHKVTLRWYSTLNLRNCEIYESEHTWIEIETWLAILFHPFSL